MKLTLEVNEIENGTTIHLTMTITNGASFLKRNEGTPTNDVVDVQNADSIILPDKVEFSHELASNAIDSVLRRHHETGTEQNDDN